MLGNFIEFGIIFFGGLLVCGVIGAAVDKLAKCKWVDKALERMIKS